jgi:hypothetical protein
MNDMQRLAQVIGASPVLAGEIRKALTVGQGWAGVNLEPVVKLMLPLYAGLRARVPVDTPKQGGATVNWKMQLGPGAWNKATAMGTAPGAVGQAVVSGAIEIDAAYCTQAVQAEVQWEAIPQGQGFSDPLQDEMMISLTDLLQLEEIITLAGNYAALVDGSSDGLATNVGSGSYTPPVKVVVAAITAQGALANKTVDAAIASSKKLGESIGQTLSPTQSTCLKCKLSWNPVAGAVGYKIYMGTTAVGATLADPNTMYWPSSSTTAHGDSIVVSGGQCYVTSTCVEIDGSSGSSSGTVGAYVNVGSGGDTNHTHGTADGTVQAYVPEGILAWCQKHTVYGQDLGTYQQLVNCAGAKLTAGGSGIKEFDQILQPLWDIWHCGPTLIIAGSRGVGAVTDQLMAINSGNLYKLELVNERGGLVGGTFIGSYLNKFAAGMIPAQAAQIPVWAHPYMEDGTFLFITEKVPYTYSKESRGFAIDMQTPYTYFELARSGRSFPYSNFYTSTLKCYHPPVQASIVGVRTQA